MELHEKIDYVRIIKVLNLNYFQKLQFRYFDCQTIKKLFITPNNSNLGINKNDWPRDFSISFIKLHY